MKINKLVAIALITVASVSSVSAAIEAEYAGLNLAQARKLGSEHLRATRLAPVVVAHHATLGGTDTDALVKAVDDHHNNDFIALAKGAIITNVNRVIDATLAADGAFIDNRHIAAIPAVAHAPADHTRDAFKTALTALINSTAPLAVAPVSKSMGALNHTRASIVAEFDAAVDAWVDSLLAGNGFFIDNRGAAAVGGLNQPADTTRDALKAALSAAINAY